MRSSRASFPVGRDERAVRAYLENAVWPDFRQSATDLGTAVGLSAAELQNISELLAPLHARYVVNQPGYYVVHPSLLITGRRG